MGVDNIQSFDCLNEMKKEEEKKKVIGSKKAIDSEERKKAAVDSDEAEKKKAVDSDEAEKKKAVDSDEAEKKVIESEKESESDSDSDSESSDSEDEDMKSSHKSGGEDYDWDGFPEYLCLPEGSESEEDLIRDSDRHEPDRGFNYVLRKCRTVTKPRRPIRTYLPRSRKDSRNSSRNGTQSVLYNLSSPLVLLTKMALARYNEIRGTSYKYVGLVKAYKSGFAYTVRFKACLEDQPPIDFQTVVLKAIPEKPKPGKNRRNCDVRVKFVYPLPAKSKSTAT